MKYKVYGHWFPVLFLLEISLFLTFSLIMTLPALFFMFSFIRTVLHHIFLQWVTTTVTLFFSLFPSQISALAHPGPLSSFCRFSNSNNCSGHRHSPLLSVLSLVLFHSYWTLVSPFLSSLARKSSHLTFATTSPNHPQGQGRVKASQHSSPKGGNNQQPQYSFSMEPDSGWLPRYTAWKISNWDLDYMSQSLSFSLLIS